MPPPQHWTARSTTTRKKLADVGSGAQYLQIDLGSEKTVNSLLVMRDNANMRIYKGVVYRLSTTSDFSSGVTTVFHNDNDNLHGLGLGESTDTEYQETENGRYVRFAPVRARYVRLYSAGSDYDTGNRYREVLVGTQEAGTAPPPQVSNIIVPIAILQSRGDTHSPHTVDGLIDGNGLSRTPTVANLSSVTQSFARAAYSWATSTQGTPDYFADIRNRPDPQFILALDGHYNLSTLVIWGQFSSAIGNEASNFRVEFSTDGGATYSPNTETVQTHSTVGSNHARLSFAMPHQANYVRLTITNNAKGRGFSGSGGDRVALGEIRFIGFAVPGPMAEVITPNTITQSRGDTHSPHTVDGLIDGNGLSRTPTVANLSSVTQSFARAAYSWATSTQGTPDYFADTRDLPDPQFILALDGHYNLSVLVIWGQFSSAIGNEASNFRVEFSTDGGATYGSNTETVQTHSTVGSNNKRLSFARIRPGELRAAHDHQQREGPRVLRVQWRPGRAGRNPVHRFRRSRADGGGCSAGHAGGHERDAGFVGAGVHPERRHAELRGDRPPQRQRQSDGFGGDVYAERRLSRRRQLHLHGDGQHE